MPRSKSHEAENRWRARLDALDASGLSVRAFAAREGLNVGSLWAWKRRLQSTTMAASSATTSFLPVIVTDNKASSPASFELVLRDGISLRIPPDFDEAALARIVRALGESR